MEKYNNSIQEKRTPKSVSFKQYIKITNSKTGYRYIEEYRQLVNKNLIKHDFTQYLEFRKTSKFIITCFENKCGIRICTRDYIDAKIRDILPYLSKKIRYNTIHIKQKSQKEFITNILNCTTRCLFILLVNKIDKSPHKRENLRNNLKKIYNNYEPFEFGQIRRIYKHQRVILEIINTFYKKAILRNKYNDVIIYTI